MNGFLDDLLDLFLPAPCVACGAPGRAICPQCALTLAGPARRVEPSPAGAPPCWAGGAYDGPLRAAILAYKERGRHTLAGPLGELLALAVLAAVGRRPGLFASGAQGAGADMAPPGDAGAGVWLVPVPTAPAAIRARGGDHTRGLAVAAVRELRRRGLQARVTPLLAVQGRRRDSVGLDAAARRANVAGAFRIRGRFGPERPAGELVLVDDLMTTGATLAEAARVLASAGWPVRQAAVLAATARRGAEEPGGAGLS